MRAQRVKTELRSEPRSGGGPGSRGTRAGRTRRARGTEARTGSRVCGKEVGGAKTEGAGGREPSLHLANPSGAGGAAGATAGRTEKGQPRAPGEFRQLAKPESRAKRPGSRSGDCGARPKPRPRPRPRPRPGCRPAQLPVPSQESSPPGSRFRNLYQNVSTRPGSAPSCTASSAASSTSPSHRPGSCSASAPAPAAVPAGLRRTAPRGSQRPSSGRDPTTSSSGPAPATAGGTTTPKRNRMAAGGAAPGLQSPCDRRTRPERQAAAAIGRRRARPGRARRGRWRGHVRCCTFFGLHHAAQEPEDDPGRGLWPREVVSWGHHPSLPEKEPGPCPLPLPAAPRTAGDASEARKRG